MLEVDSLGATYLGAGRCQFLVWASKAQRIDLVLMEPDSRVVPLDPLPRGYFGAVVEQVEPGVRYLFRIDNGQDRPDPASRHQPHGVHAASEVVDPNHTWNDGDWKGRPLADYITYELHIGTFTPEGTFEAAIGSLDQLVELGVTAVELMPVAQFPGDRNWGYDGVHPFAVQHSYGGHSGLKQFVEACHERQLAVILDVVYNHLGPEGNYLHEFAHYFTGRYQTPWGDAINFDGPHSDEVKRLFLENALEWIRDFHIDALRLDAVHAIYDRTARPFLQELAAAVRAEGQRTGRAVFTIAESNLNDPRMLAREEAGGTGIDAQWADDLHHALASHLTGDQFGYYADYGGVGDIAKALRDGFVYQGQYSSYRGRRHGAPAGAVRTEQFTVCIQNHDQVGNRMLGERLSSLVSFETSKLAAAVILLSPYQPLLFMGEEYGEVAPFLYFIDHGDPALVQAVRRGRQEGYDYFGLTGDAPDPQDPQTFARCKLNSELRKEGRHRQLFAYYQELIRLRKRFRQADSSVEPRKVTMPSDGLVTLERELEEGRAVVVFNFDQEVAELTLPNSAANWQKILDSSESRWGGSQETSPSATGSGYQLAPQSAAVFQA